MGHWIDLYAIWLLEVRLDQLRASRIWHDPGQHPLPDNNPLAGFPGI